MEPGKTGPTDFEALTETFDETGVMYREMDPEETNDLAGRFGVGELVRRGDPEGRARGLFLAREGGRSPGPVMLFDCDGSFVGLGDDRTRPAATPEFYGRGY